MNKAIQEMKWESFSREVMVDNLTRDEASVLEQEFIALYDSTDPAKGFNIAYGGVRFRHNMVSKRKISQTSTPRSNDFRRKKYCEQEPFKHGISQFALNGELMRQFSSIREAAKATSSDPSNIRKCANGVLKTTNHFIWKFT